MYIYIYTRRQFNIEQFWNLECLKTDNANNNALSPFRLLVEISPRRSLKILRIFFHVKSLSIRTERENLFLLLNSDLNWYIYIGKI